MAWNLLLQPIPKTGTRAAFKRAIPKFVLNCIVLYCTVISRYMFTYSHAAMCTIIVKISKHINKYNNINMHNIINHNI